MLGHDFTLRKLNAQISEIRQGGKGTRKGSHALGRFAVRIGTGSGLVILIQLLIIYVFPGTPLPVSQSNIVTNVVVALIVATLGTYVSFAVTDDIRPITPFIIAGIIMMIAYWTIYFIIFLELFT